MGSNIHLKFFGFFLTAQRPGDYILVFGSTSHCQRSAPVDDGRAEPCV